MHCIQQTRRKLSHSAAKIDINSSQNEALRGYAALPPRTLTGSLSERPRTRTMCVWGATSPLFGHQAGKRNERTKPLRTVLGGNIGCDWMHGQAHSTSFSPPRPPGANGATEDVPKCYLLRQKMKDR